MVGIVTQSTSLNSFWSICYCVLVLGVQGYTTYLAVTRYQEASANAWPGGGGTPGEVVVYLVLIVLSLLCLPLFALTALLKIGNYANDGIKLGRDHALNSNFDAVCQKVKNGVAKRLWRHFCPFAQTFHLVSAFCLLLPDTLLTAVEVDYGYKTTDAGWTSDLDFMFPSQRAHLSDIKSSINVTETGNSTVMVIPTPRPPSWGWTNKYSLSVAFVNFVAALFAFSVRYASVFWYTNKALTAVFAGQLFFMSITCMFGFCGFSVLYKIGLNHELYWNVHLVLSYSFVLGLYLTSGLITLLSTMTVFEYGSHYFHEKFKIIEKKHHPETFVKQTIIVQSGCQGYVPHSCAMVALIVFAVCKGPILYDLVAAYRVTKDELVLATVVMEVCYMMFWIALWFVLTIKQQWRFRILDYVPLGQPIFMVQDTDHIVKNPTFDSDQIEMSSLQRNKERRRRRKESPPGYLEAVSTRTGSDEPSHSDDGTEDSEAHNTGDSGNGSNSLDSQPTVLNGGLRRKSRNRKNGNQRVTFDESVRASLSADEDMGPPRCRSPINVSRLPADQKQVNVTVDVHNGLEPSPDSQQINTRPQSVPTMRLQRQNSGNDATLTREYRNSLRSKCGEYYSNVNNLSSCSDEASTMSEPLPTLMSSFRDKVRESSKAANNYKEQRKIFDNIHGSNLKNSNINHIENSDSTKRKGIVEGEVGEVSLKLNSIPKDGKESSGQQSKRNSSHLNSDDNKRTSSGMTISTELPLIKDPASRNLVNGTTTPELLTTAGDGGRLDLIPSVADKGDHRHHPFLHHPPPPYSHHPHEYLFPRPIHLVTQKPDIGRRDSANYSLTSSQETSSNDSDHGQGLCSQV